jgi:hypothetical protein
MRWIGSSGAYKAAIWRREARKVDWDALMADCAARAEAVKAEGGRPRMVEARLARLRIEYKSLLRSRHFARTGVNLSHVGLEN